MGSRDGYNYIVRLKKPVGDQELEGYKTMGVTLGLEEKLFQNRQRWLIGPLPAVLSVVTPARKNIH